MSLVISDIKDKISQAKYYSLAVHLVQIQASSEKKLQMSPLIVQSKHSDVGLSQTDQSLDDQDQISTALASEDQQNTLMTAVSDVGSELNQQSKKTLDLLDVFIDAKDSVNNWCIAKIIDHDLLNNRISIHFDGWSARYDETVKINSSRIACFRKYTTGYTGQQNTALRDFDLNYAYQVTLLNRIQRIRESEFQCFADATECIQFIRGEMYIYFDSLISLVTEASQADIQKIFEFITEVFSLCLKWIEIFPKYLEIFNLCQHHPNLLMVDLQAAISQCGYEIFHMIQKCMGLCERSNRFFRMYKAAINIESDIIEPLKMNDNGLMLSTIGQFEKMNGFDQILALIKIGAISKEFKCPIKIICYAINSILKLNDLGLKKSFVEELYQNVAVIVEERLSSEYLTDNDLKEVHLEELKQLIKYIAYIKSQFTELDRHEISEIYELNIAKRLLMCPFFEKRIKGMKEFKHIQEKVLNRGQASQSQDRRQQAVESTKFLDKQKFSQWIIDNQVIEFIFKENPHQELIKRSQSILTIMAYDASTFPEETINLIWQCCSIEKHEDIIRATFELLKELASSLPLSRLENLFQKVQTINIQQIDDKTVQFLKVYTINTISNLMSFKRKTHDAQSLSNKGNNTQQGITGGISNILNHARGSMTSKRSVVSTSTLQQQSVQQTQKNIIDNEKFFNLNLFWEIAQDTNQGASNKTKDLALSSLIDILKFGQSYQSNIKEYFINTSLENIKKGNTVYLSINFLQNLLSTFKHDDLQYAATYTNYNNRNKYGQSKNQQQEPEASIESVIGTIQKQSDIYEDVIIQAASYMKLVSLTKDKLKGQIPPHHIVSAINSQIINSSIEPEPEKNQELICFKNNIPHEDHIKVFIRFIEFIVTNSKTSTLCFQHVQEMFKIFVTEAVSELETREFFNFLTKQNNDPRSSKRSLLDQNLRFQVFIKIMCNEKSMNCKNIDLQAFECFRNLFVGVNVQEKAFTVDKETNAIEYVTNFDLLKGLNTMWKICLQCESEDVKEISRCILCDLYLLIKSKNQGSRIKAHEQFIKTCRQQLLQAQNEFLQKLNMQQNSKIIFNCFRLIKTFIIRFEKEHLKPELKATMDNLSTQEQRNTKVVTLKFEPGFFKTEVVVNLNCKFWEIMRIASSDRFNMKMSDFYILTKNGPLNDQIYNHQMKDYDLNEITLQKIPHEIMEKEFPNYVIGYSKDCMEAFLDVLGNHKDEITNEGVNLLERLQINPKIKNSINERIRLLPNIKQNILKESDDSQQDDPSLYNFANWQDILMWQTNGELNWTFYKLSCIKELVRGRPGSQTGLNGPQGNPNIIQYQKQSQQYIQEQEQEKIDRFENQKQLLNKGGFNYLLHIFNNLDKTVNFDQDVLTSKTLQLLIFLLNNLHSKSLQPIMSTIAKPRHLSTMLNGCLIIVHSFLKNVIDMQKLKFNQLYQQQVQIQNLQGDASNGALPAISSASLNQIHRQIEEQPIETLILTAALNFLSKILMTYPNSFRYLQPNDKFYQILQLGLIETHQKKIQEKIHTFSWHLCSDIEKTMITHMKLQSENAGNKIVELPATFATTLPSFLILKKAINEFLPLSLKEQITQKTRQLYKLINQILAETEVHKSMEKIGQPQALVKHLIKVIQERQINEGTSRDEDVVLSGLFEFLGKILVRFTQVREQLVEKKAFIQFLTHHGLFKKEKRMISDRRANLNLPPMCKNTSTRNQCLELLRILCQDDLQDKLYITSYLKQNVCNETFWRTPKRVDWNIHAQQQERALSGYVGLKNLGCTCYMNCIMQQLYMIPAFRKAIIEVEDRHSEQQPDKENELFQIKCIYGGLMEIDNQYFNTKKFCRAFKDIDGSSIDPQVQKDVDEFFNMFMDRIESHIKGTKEEKIMNNLFQGVLANEFICKDCPHYSEREEPFLAISLQVKNKNSIQDSLKYYVEGEMLEGDNAYYCEKCEKKVNTLKRCCIKRMPNILFLVLKRFEFDFETMQKVKVDDYCEFPFELDMSPFSQQELSRQDLLKTMDEKNLSVDDLNEDQQHIVKRKLPENYYKYTLKGIVVHNGTADQGHYYSFIQDRENKNSGWFEFNDDKIRDFDLTKIPEEAFGGDDCNIAKNINEMQAQNNGQFDPAIIQAMNQFKTKSKNAYVLIYDRIETYDNLKINDLIDDTKTVNLNQKELAKQYSNCRINQQTSGLVPQIPHNIHDVILAKNKKFWLSKTIFSVSFIQQMYQIFKDSKISADKDYLKYSDPQFNLQASDSKDQFEAFKFIITFFLTVAIRSRERSVLPDYVALIREALKQNIGLSLWYIEIFSSQDFVKEFLIDCPIHDMSRFVQGLLKTAMQQVYEFEKEQIAEYNKIMNTAEGPMGYIRQTQSGFIEEDTIIDGQNLPNNIDTTICSGSSQVNLVRLRTHSNKLPKLIVMMNALIHMSASSYLQKNQKMTGQFWGMFASFSILGDQARLYLLQTKCLGRLIDILLNSSQDSFFSRQAVMDYQLKFRDESIRKNVPFFISAKEPYFGMDPERSQVQLSSIEKKEIQLRLCSPITFLILTISNLARSCSLVKTNVPSSTVDGNISSRSGGTFALDQLNFVPDKEEIELLQSNQNVRWWNPSYQKVARNAIALMFAHICTDNKEFSVDYISNLIVCVGKENSIFVRQYERPLLRVCQLADKFQSERIRRVLQKLFELSKNYTQFYMQMDSIMEIIYKLSLRCPNFAQTLRKHHQDFIKLLERYFKESPTLPVTKDKNKIFKEGHIKWSDIKLKSFLNQQKLDWIEEYTRQRTARLLSLLEKSPQEQARISKQCGSNDFRDGEQDMKTRSSLADDINQGMRKGGHKQTIVNPQPQYYNPEELLDSDDDMFNRQFQQGDSIDFCLNNNVWYKGVVSIALDEMIQCVAIPAQGTQQQQQVLHWCGLENDKLAPPNSITSNDREHLHKFFTDLSTFVVRGNSYN